MVALADLSGEPRSCVGRDCSKFGDANVLRLVSCGGSDALGASLWLVHEHRTRRQSKHNLGIQLPLGACVCDAEAVALGIALGVAARHGHHHGQIAPMIESVAHSFLE